jgi:hypothetical protein
MHTYVASIVQQVEWTRKERLNLKIPVWFEYVLLVVLTLTGVAVITWPMFASPTTAIHGFQGDSIGSMYDFWYARHHGFSFLPGARNHLLSYPVGMSAGGPLLLPGVLLFVPGVLLTGLVNEIFAYNVLIVLGMLLPVIASYAFFRLVPYSRSISMVLATGFILAPFHQLSELSWYGQSQLVGIPLAAITALKFQRYPSQRNLIYNVLAVVVGFLTNAYVGLFAAVVVSCGLVVGTIVHWKQLLKRLTELTWKTWFAILALAATTTAILFILSSLVKKDISRSSTEIKVYGLRTPELFHPTPYSAFGDSRLGLKAVTDLHGSNWIEVSQYVGLSVLVLAICGLIVSVSKKKSMELQSFSGLLMVVAFWFGASQGLKFGPLKVIAPATVINQLAPFWRVYSRFGLLIFFGLLISAGVFLQYCSELIQRRWLRYLMSIGVSFVLFIDLLVIVPGASMKFSVPGYVKFLSRQVTGVVMEYPLAGGNDTLRYQRRFDQRNLELPSVNGDIETDSRLVRIGMTDPRDAKTIEGLLALNVRWVVIQDWVYQSLQLDIIQFESRHLVLRFEGEGVRVFELLSFKAAATAWIEDGGFAQEVINDRMGQWVGAKSKLVVVQNRSGCVAINLNITRYTGINEIYLNSGKKRLQVQQDGIIKFIIGPFNEMAEVEITSPNGEIPVPGPDPRSITAWIDSDISVNAIACK